MDLFTDLTLVTEENIHEFNVPEVWALFGMRKDLNDKTYYCLQVGQKMYSIKDDIESSYMERRLKKSSKILNLFLFQVRQRIKRGKL